ncbi:PAS domain S-box protein [Chitinivorax sp. B]|uniref:sensor domain-containing diguanylate cyclase n=1 Tax=Chitinivorax sp. B TaxID=2502235 RepID=UPI0010F5D6AE|nr:PAS domain S-box protein [Chitinivorax sp. B]
MIESPSPLPVSHVLHSSLALLAAAPVGLYVTDTLGSCIYANPRWSDISGMPAWQALGQGWVQALHPEDRERIYQRWSEVANEQTEFEDEYRYLRPDGTIRWLHGVARVFRQSDGEIGGYIGTVTDITHRKVLEQARERQSQVMEAITRCSPFGIFHLSAQGHIMSMNPAAELMFGHRSDESCGQLLETICPHPPKGDPSSPAWQRTLLKRPAYQPGLFEERVCQRRDGTLFPVRRAASLLVDAEGRSLGRLEVMQDIGLEIELREALVAREARLKGILDHVTDAIFTIDQAGNLLSTNPALARLFGYSVTMLLGQPLDMLLPRFRESDSRGFIDTISQTPTGVTDEHGHWEMTARHRNGATFPIHLSLAAYIMGEQRQFTGVLHDLRQLKEREAHLCLQLQRVLETNVQMLCETGRLEAQNDALSKLAGIDEATGLSNRQLFEQQLTTAWLHHLQLARPLALLRLDIDRFEPCFTSIPPSQRQTYLGQIATALSQGVTRTGDMLAQYGEGRFVVMLTNTGEVGALMVAERLRLLITSLPHQPPPDFADPLTLSIGVASMVPTHQEQPAHLVMMADQALFLAQRNGCNQVSCFLDR